MKIETLLLIGLLTAPVQILLAEEPVKKQQGSGGEIESIPHLEPKPETTAPKEGTTDSIPHLEPTPEAMTTDPQIVPKKKKKLQSIPHLEPQPDAIVPKTQPVLKQQEGESGSIPHL